MLWIMSIKIMPESSDLCKYTKACLDPQIKITARLLLPLLNQSVEQE